MVLYKYTRKPGMNRIPAYESTSNTKDVIKYMEGDSILSEMEPIDIGGDKLIYSISDGLFYPMRLNTKDMFTQTTVVDAMVNSICKSGLAIYNSTKVDRKEIRRLNKGEHLILNMGFVTDANDNIWASVSVVNDSFEYEVEKGFVIYKNSRNNFANLIIPNATYNTVLTNGKIDSNKIQIVQQQSNIALMSNQTIDLSGISGTTNAKKKLSKKQSKKAAEELKKTTDYFTKIRTRDPSIVQNDEKFPPVVGKIGDVYQYSYIIDCGNIPGLQDLSAMRKHENMDVDNIRKNFKYNTEYYNRFKTAMPDDVLTRGFMHIFFTRPDCNLLTIDRSKLNEDIDSDPSLSYIYAKKPDLVKQLVLNNGENHDFMMLLSNKAKSFSLTDEGITSDKYGKSFGGHSVAFGRRKDSELGGSFEVSYDESRDLDIINLHKLWIDYINNVYRGKWSPKIEYIYNKIIDYACSVYVIITAEDFETILFWTKYYGVFPVNVPYSALSWNGNGVITNPNVSISYQYSWKEDFNPLGLTELNINTFRKKNPGVTTYRPTFNTTLGRTGYTWVGAPFVETIKYDAFSEDPTNGSKVTSKLRFRYKD